MKILLVLGCLSISIYSIRAQDPGNKSLNKKEIRTLIDQYAQSRETRDTVLLRHILTEDVDQLVSTGEWRRGQDIALKGMLRSSTRNPGGRTLNVEKIRFLNTETAVVDARYEIQNPDGTLRKMWSTFIVLFQVERWKIAAIRNMRPAK